jgi:predicted metal-dependent hydrolase
MFKMTKVTWTKEDIIDTIEMMAFELNKDIRTIIIDDKKEENCGYYFPGFKDSHAIVINMAYNLNDEELIDTIAHELAHIKYHNHCKGHRVLTKEYANRINVYL